MAYAPNTLFRSRRTRFDAGLQAGRSLGLPGGTTRDRLRQVEKGFAYETLVCFHKRSGIPIGTIADLVQLPQRTLMRRKAKGRLRPDESERLLRISGVFEKA